MSRRPCPTRPYRRGQSTTEPERETARATHLKGAPQMSTNQAFAATVAMPSGAILTPDDPAWDEARQAWNLAVDQRPTAIAMAATPEDVVAVLASARRLGLRVAAQGTGHNAAPFGSLADTI